MRLTRQPARDMAAPIRWVLRRQQSDLAQSTRLMCEMRVLITGHLGFIGATSPAACHQCHRDRRGRSRVSKNVSSRRNMADA
jgi:hypothetical protein